MTDPAPPEAKAAWARRHAVQRAVARLAAPLWVPAAALALRLGFGYRIEDASGVRATFRRLREESSAPLLVCANHLTLVDSFLVAWALAPAGHFVRHFDDLPWNVPEARNFASRWWSRMLSYLAKCIPIVRGGPPQKSSEVMARLVHLLGRGEVALLFPEGGRSRTGRVDTDTPAWGVGRVVASLPDCRVLCVYLRGRRQASWSRLPVRGERFRVAAECIEPKSDARGVRRSRELAAQVVSRLARMERDQLDARQ